MYYTRAHLLRLLLIVALAWFPLSASADDTVYTKVDVNPVPVKTPPPDYPESMKRQGVSGVVAVTIVIDETGTVISGAVAKSSQPDFEEPAVRAVKKWKFKPAQKDGTPVKMRVTVPIRFNLEE